VAQLARRHEVRRQVVYDLRDESRRVLERAFGEAGVDQPSGLRTLKLTDADVARTVIALRVVAPSSLRDEVAMLPIIYGSGWSYGKIWGVLAEAERRATAFLDAVDLSAIEYLALDEMFSQGRPVFGGIDLDTQYLFQLEVHDGRSGEDWRQSLARLRDDNNLDPVAVAKDAGTGLASGVQQTWPGVEERDDLFHAVYMMGQEAYHLERRAYATIAAQDELERRRGRAKDESKRRSLGQQLRQARGRTEVTIERYDHFERLRREATDILQLADRGSGRLRTSAEVVATLTRVAEEMATLGTRRVRKVARYIGNRAAGLGRYLDALGQRLHDVTEQAGGPGVVAALVRAYQAELTVRQGGPAWDRKDRRQELDAAADNLLAAIERSPARFKQAMSTVVPILAQRNRGHRSKSASHAYSSPERGGLWPSPLVSRSRVRGCCPASSRGAVRRPRPSPRWAGSPAG